MSGSRIRVEMLLPLEDYADGVAVAAKRGVSFTEMLRGAVATEAYFRDAQADGKRLMIEDRHGNRTEVVFNVPA